MEQKQDFCCREHPRRIVANERYGIPRMITALVLSSVIVLGARSVGRSAIITTVKN